jgi:hypothetical protein
MKNYTINIASHKGHETQVLELEEAVESIIKNSTEKSRWVYINGQKFEFEGSDHRNAVNVANLKQALTATEDPMILLTGELRGGK